MRCAYCALQGLRSGEFRRVGECVDAIEHSFTVRNKNPKPFVWTAKTNGIIQKVIRVNSRLGFKQNEALH